MANDSTPVVFKASSRSRLIALAFGFALMVAGILMIMDDSGSLLGYGVAPRVRPNVAGWLVLGLGAAVSSAGLLGLIRGCPVLELREDGISYSRCLQGVTHIAWSDFDHVEVTRTSVPSTSGSDINLEGIVLITGDGRRIGIAPIAPVPDLESAIARTATMFKARSTS